MKELIEKGGARIGFANATWPFATLKVSKDKLELNASVIGNLVFRPEDIISIVPQAGFLGRGLKIIHRVPKYKDTVIFWTVSNPVLVKKRIDETGFLANDSPLPTATETEIVNSQSKDGFPIKLPAIVIFGIVWNVLLLLDFTNFLTSEKQRSPLGVGTLTALSFAFVTDVLILAVGPFRRLILKEGRTLNDIKTFVYFMMFICGVMILSIMFTN